MTLTKILGVLPTMALLFWLVVPPPLCDGINARVDITKAAVGRNGPIAKSLDSFREDVGHYPDATVGLKALCQAPTGLTAEDYGGPYLECAIEDLTDAWGNPSGYRAPRKFNNDGFDLYSFGSDGIDDGGRDGSDDIKNWR